MNDNLAGIIALEWLTAAQGVDFLAPHAPAVPLAEAHRRLRARVARLDTDRFFAPDIASAKALLLAGVLNDLVADPLVASHSY